MLVPVCQTDSFNRQENKTSVHMPGLSGKGGGGAVIVLGRRRRNREEEEADDEVPVNTSRKVGTVPVNLLRNFS